MNIAEPHKSDRIIALAGAIVFHALLLLSFCLSYMTWPPLDDEGKPIDPEEDQAEILLVNEYINLGDMITSEVPADAPKAESDAGESISESIDMENQGKPAQPVPPVTSKQPSPMQVREKPKPEKTGPTKEELEAEARAKKEAAAREKINRQMTFSGNGKGEGISGTGEGDAVNGTLDGSPSHTLSGRKVLSYGKNSSRKAGSIQVAITVNAAGEVISARYAGGSGSASGDSDLRQRTVAAARATRFSALPEGSRDQKGTLTWKFK